MDLKESICCIFIRDMRVNVRIGLLEAEKLAPQKLDVTIECFAAPAYLKRAAEGQDLIDYAALYNEVKSWEAAEHTDLLETLAGRAFAAGFAFEAVQAVRVCLSKPDIFEATDRAGIDITLSRDTYSGT